MIDETRYDFETSYRRSHARRHGVRGSAKTALTGSMASVALSTISLGIKEGCNQHMLLLRVESA
jgi:hypothetical protein